MTNKAKVELRQAFEWTCDECGRDQFISVVCEPASEEIKREILEREGVIESWEEMPEGVEFEAIAAPLSVTCEHCGETFETDLPDGEE